jgi:hypothetical protein
VEEFKYLGTNLANQNSVQEELKIMMKSGKSCSHSVQNLFSSSLLSKNTKIKVYITVILPIVLCGFESWLHTLREECRLWVGESRVLTIIFGPKRDEVMGVEKMRKLHNEELRDLYSLPDIIWVIKLRRMKWARHVAHRGSRRGYTGFWVGKLEVKRPLGIPRHR